MNFIWAGVLLLVTTFGLIVLRGAPYVPTHRRQLKRAFDELYPLSSKDTLVDLGSGDGIVLQVAGTKGAKAIGYELNPILVLFSRIRLRKCSNITVKTRDFMRMKQLPDSTTVVYAFTTGHSIDTIGEKMEQWSKERTLSFISYGFMISDKQPLRSIGPMHLYEFSDSKE